MSSPESIISHFKALANHWRRDIKTYDEEHINSSDPEDWVGPKRDCLMELDEIIDHLRTY